MKCIVCDQEKASYRCRTCRSAYCSSTCYKKHRQSKEEAIAAQATTAKSNTEDAAAAINLEYLCEVVMAAQEPQREQEAKRQRTEAEADVFSDLSREKAAAASQRGRLGDASPHVTTSASESHAEEPPVSPLADVAESAAGAKPDAKEAMEEEEEVIAADADAVYILQEKHLSALANDPAVRSALRSPSLQKLIRTIDSSRSRLDALDAAQYNNADFKHFCNDVMRAIARAEGR